MSDFQNTTTCVQSFNFISEAQLLCRWTPHETRGSAMTACAELTKKRKRRSPHAFILKCAHPYTIQICDLPTFTWGWRYNRQYFTLSSLRKQHFTAAETLPPKILLIFSRYFVNMDPTTAKESEKTCVLCCQDIDIFALGKCDHPVCYRCSTKMRVLCDQKYCAVCREELDKVRIALLL